VSPESPAPSVRPLVFGDIPAVVTLAASCPEAAQWTPSSYEMHFEDIRGWVAPEQDRLLGFLALRVIETAHEAEILNIAVEAKARRKSFASALLEAAISYCAAREVQAMFLEVRETNAGAISFYKKHGFVISGRRPGYYRNPDEAAISMARSLAN
jgi:ribosomal-protein-alanine N-acetyltransferase